MKKAEILAGWMKEANLSKESSTFGRVLGRLFKKPKVLPRAGGAPMKVGPGQALGKLWKDYPAQTIGLGAGTAFLGSRVLGGGGRSRDINVTRF